MVQDSNANYEPGETPVKLRDLYDVKISDSVAGTQAVVFVNNALEVVAPVAAPDVSAVTDAAAKTALTTIINHLKATGQLS